MKVRPSVKPICENAKSLNVKVKMVICDNQKQTKTRLIKEV